MFPLLRARAATELGERFDIRAFHTAVLTDGQLPLAVLEAKIDRWIDSVNAGRAEGRRAQAPASGLR